MPSLPRAIHGLGIAGSGDTPAPAGGPRKEKYRIMDKRRVTNDRFIATPSRNKVFVGTVAAIDHSSRGASSLSAI